MILGYYLWGLRQRQHGHCGLHGGRHPAKHRLPRQQVGSASTSQ